MMKRVLVILSLACVVFLQPKPSEAGLADFIWGLSGPQMLGVGYGCRFTPSIHRESCEIGGGLAASEASLTTPPTILLSLGGMVFRSTGKDGKEKDKAATPRYSPGDVYMFGIEPGVSLRYRIKNTVAYSNISISSNYFFGTRRDVQGQSLADPGVTEALRFKPFWRHAIKLDFIEVRVPNTRLMLGANLRLYPRGFTKSDFIPGPAQHSETRGLEPVLGFSVGWLTN